MKSKIRIPRIAIILFIVALIGPGVQLGKYVLNSQPSIVAQSVSVDSTIHLKTAKSTSSNDLNRSLLDYQIIVKNDLFDPLGAQRALTVAAIPQQMVQVEKKQAPPDPLYKLTFTGVVQLESEDSAIVEDFSKNKAYYLKKGDKLRDCTVEAIAEDNIVLSNGNSKFSIQIGSSFYYNSGGQITTSEPLNNQAIAKVSESKTEESASINSGSANLSLIEQMKARPQKGVRSAMKYKRKSLTIIILLISLIAFIISNPVYAQETNQNNNHNQLISMSFREAELDYVLDFFSRATGYTIIKDADIKVRITIISQKDVPVDEALSVLNSILAIKGYAMIINGKVIKVVPLESAKQENMEIKVGSDPASIEQTDSIVTQIMPLSYTSVAQVVKELKDLVPKYGVMVAHTQSNTLIITATSANINRFAQIIKALDIPMSDLIKIEVFFLKYRDAETLATVITKMFEKTTGTTTDQQNINNARRARGGFPGMPNFGPDQQGDQSQSSTTEESQRLLIMGDVKVSSDKTTNSLVVSASPSNLSLIKDVVAKLDVQTSAQAETRIFTLEHADATTTAEEINDAFSATSTSRTSSTQSIFNRQGFGGFPGGPGGFGQQGNQSSSTGTGVLGLPEVRVVGEQRTNSLIVTTTSVQMDSIATLIKQLDQDVSEYEQTTMIVPLENAEASNMATVLNSLFQTTAFEQQRGRSSFSSTSGGVMGTSATTVATARGLTGNVKIVAESSTNSLGITTYKRNFPTLMEIIKELDVMLPQVLIEVEIVEVTLNEDTKFGVEWKLAKTTNVNDTNYQQSGSSKFGLTDEVYGLKYGLINNTIEMLLMTLEKDTKVNIRSTPRILTQDNHEAVINISQSVPYLSSTQETTTGGVLTSYEYQDVGVILTVTPRINKSETVTMSVDQQINNLIEFTLFNAPVISKREATASVTVKDGQTMIIGGIIQDNKTETINRVPILSSIPLIGRFFQRKDSTPEKTELMVFITPHIIHNPEEAERFSQKPATAEKSH